MACEARRSPAKHAGGERSRAQAGEAGRTSSASGNVKDVYLLESISHPGERYVGKTTDLWAGLRDHNAGKSTYTTRFTPWQLVVAVRFEDDARADAFERYLKSGSGHAFAKRHFW